MTTAELLAEIGEAVIVDGVKHRIRAFRDVVVLEATANVCSPADVGHAERVADLALAGPTWHRAPITATIRIRALAWDDGAGLWRIRP